MGPNAPFVCRCSPQPGTRVCKGGGGGGGRLHSVCTLHVSLVTPVAMNRVTGERTSGPRLSGPAADAFPARDASAPVRGNQPQELHRAVVPRPGRGPREKSQPDASDAVTSHGTRPEVSQSPPAEGAAGSSVARARPCEVPRPGTRTRARGPARGPLCCILQHVLRSAAIFKHKRGARTPLGRVVSTSRVA